MSPLQVTAFTTKAAGPTFRVKITNNGTRAGDEVVLAFITQPSITEGPLKRLFGFDRIHLNVGETKEVFFSTSPDVLAIVDDQGRKIVHPGLVKVLVGDVLFDLVVQGESVEVC